MAKVTALSSLGWAHYTLFEALPRMAARGFRRVEIASFSTYCFHFNYGSPKPTELRNILRGLGLTPVCLNFFHRAYEAWRPEEIGEFVRDFTRKVEHLGEVGIPMMTMGFGWRNRRPDRKRQLGNAVKAYDRMGRVAERLGVRMLLEVPHLYQIHDTAERVLWVFERLSSPNVGACVDCSHWGVIGYDLEAFLAALGGRLWHVHLRDSRRTGPGPEEYQLELTPGRGTVDFARFGRCLDAVKYGGDVSVEFEYRDMPLDRIEAEFDRGLRHLKKCGWRLPDGARC
jgi:sugar phosphate isomerase/epimerase